MDLVETRVGSHGTVKIELQPSEGLRPVGAVQRAAELARDAFEDAMSTVRTIAQGVADEFGALQATNRPKKVEIEFGLKVSSEAGAVIAKATAEGQFSVTLTWEA